jgi:hypothetical protein
MTMRTAIVVPRPFPEPQAFGNSGYVRCRPSPRKVVLHWISFPAGGETC